MRRMRPMHWFVLVILLAGAVRPPGTSGHPSSALRAVTDSSDGAKAVRHFYALYAHRRFEALYDRAAPPVRQGMAQSEFVQFMRKKRDRLGPVRSVSVEEPASVPDEGGATVRATVQYARGRRGEAWTLVRRKGTIQWRAFRTTQSATSKQRKLETGTPVPSFEVPALRDSSRVITPSAFRDRYVLLNFWATWCAPCVEKIPTLRTAHRRYPDRLTILNISFDRSRSDVISFLKNRAVPGTHAFAGIRALRGPLDHKFDIDGIPNPVLVGPMGRIAATETEIERDGLLRTLEETIGS